LEVSSDFQRLTDLVKKLLALPADGSASVGRLLDSHP
jgi:hypothetical protein